MHVTIYCEWARSSCFTSDIHGARIVAAAAKIKLLQSALNVHYLSPRMPLSTIAVYANKCFVCGWDGTEYSRSQSALKQARLLAAAHISSFITRRNCDAPRRMIMSFWSTNSIKYIQNIMNNHQSILNRAHWISRNNYFDDELVRWNNESSCAFSEAAGELILGQCWHEATSYNATGNNVCNWRRQPASLVSLLYLRHFSNVSIYIQSKIKCWEMRR